MLKSDLRDYLPSTIQQFTLVLGQYSSIEMAIDRFLEVDQHLPSGNPIIPLFREVRRRTRSGIPAGEAFRQVGFESGERHLAHFFAAIARVLDYGGDLSQQLEDIVSTTFSESHASRFRGQGTGAFRFLCRAPLSLVLRYVGFRPPIVVFRMLQLLLCISFALWSWYRRGSLLFAVIHGLIGLLIGYPIVYLAIERNLRRWGRDFSFFLSSVARALTTNVVPNTAIQMVLRDCGNDSETFVSLAAFFDMMKETRALDERLRIARGLHQHWPFPETTVFLHAMLFAELNSPNLRALLQLLADQVRLRYVR